MILHCLPVLPLSMRYHIREDDFGNVSFVPVSIEVPYRRVVHRAQRCSKLIHLKGRVALYIVLKDKQLLQEAADSLICNGAYKPPYSDMGGIPYLSLNSLNNTVGRYAGNLRISGGWDVKKILGLVAEMKELEDYIQDDPEEYSAGEHQLYNETRDCLLVNLQSFAYRYFDNAYTEHASLAGKAIEYILDDFVPYVIDDYRYILNRSSQRMLNPDNELHVKLFEKTVLTHLESGIQDRADLYAEHRAKWDAATLGSIFG